MNNLGEEIKRTRIEKGLSVEDLSNKTMLSAAVIRDIENGAFDRYKGDETYVKMYLKKISKALELDADEVTQTYMDLTEELKKEDLKKESEKQEARQLKRKEFQFENPKFAGNAQVYEDKSHVKIIRGVIVGLVAALIIGVVWYGISVIKTPSEPTDFTDPTTQVDGSVDTKKEEEKKTETKRTETKKEEKQAVFKRTGDFSYKVTIPKDKKNVVIRIKLTDKAWLGLYVDGEELSKYPGKVYDKGNVKFTIPSDSIKKTIRIRSGANHPYDKYYINKVKIPLIPKERKTLDFTLNIKVVKK